MVHALGQLANELCREHNHAPEVCKGRASDSSCAHWGRRYDGGMNAHELLSSSPSCRAICCCRHVALAAATSEQAATPGPPSRSKDSLLTRPGYGLLAATIKGLRLHAPAGYPVIVRTGGVGLNLDGFCVRRPARFVIHLNDRLGPSAAVSVLVHEWSHALAWSHSLDRAVEDLRARRITQQEFEDLCHGPAFGVEYATCWRVLTGIVMPEFAKARRR